MLFFHKKSHRLVAITATLFAQTSGSVPVRFFTVISLHQVEQSTQQTPALDAFALAAVRARADRLAVRPTEHGVGQAVGRDHDARRPAGAEQDGDRQPHDHHQGSQHADRIDRKHMEAPRHSVDDHSAAARTNIASICASLLPRRGITLTTSGSSRRTIVVYSNLA